MLVIDNRWQSHQEKDGTVHIVPLGDTRQHTEGECWCNPTWIDTSNGDVAVAHYAHDERDRYVNKIRLPH